MFILINPTCDDPRRNSFPLGLSYIAGVLKKENIEYMVMDLNCDKKQEDLIKALLKYDVFFVGITMASDLFDSVSSIARLIKRFSPHTIIGVGGPHATYQADDILDKNMEFDVAFLGAGEASMMQIAQNYRNNIKWTENVPNIVYRDEQNVIHNSPAKMIKYLAYPDRVSFPDVLHYSKKYNDATVPIVSIDTSRGCHGNCSFCCLKVDYNPQLLCRSIEEIKNEIVNLSDIYMNSVFDVYLTDADFLSTSIRAFKILSVLKTISNIRYIIMSARSDSVVKCKESLEQIFISKCSILELGIESASQSQLDRYNKQCSVETNFYAVELLQPLAQKYKAKISIDLIPFDPFVTIEELQETYNFMEKYFYGIAGYEQAFFTKMTLYPGTKLYDIAQKEGLLLHNPGGKPPYWKFKNNHSAIVYKWISAYETLLYPKVKELIKITNKYLEKMKIDIVPKSPTFIYYRKLLNDMTYKYVKEILFTTEGNYSEIFVKYQAECKKIKSFVEKLNV